MNRLVTLALVSTVALVASGFCLNAAAEQPEADDATLVIEGVSSPTWSGNAMICLFNTEDAFKSADMHKPEKDEQSFKSVQDVRIQYRPTRAAGLSKNRIIDKSCTTGSPCS